MKKDNYITPAGYQRLVDEHEHLSKYERPELCKTIAWAAGNGDRSENADYIYGKKRLREIDRRLRFLNKQINEAVVIDPTKQSFEQVRFGATVTVEDEEGRQRVYSIVGVDEVDTKKNYISWKSPIGKSLLHREVGDEILIRTPKGEVEFVIIDIKYEAIK